MSSPVIVGAINLATMLGIMLVLWLLSLFKRDASIVDPFWPAGFVISAWRTVWLADPPGARPWLLVGMTTVWGLRLSGFLLWRNWGEPEDYRYAEMRQKHGSRFVFVSLLTVFALQGLLLWIVSWPVQFGQLAVDTSLGVLDLLGIALWSVGVFFEAVGDFQLARFKSRPENRGRVLDTGLWRYTRHPNYFGDFCVWWGIYLVATSGGAWWTAVGPFLMSYLLFRFSGVALLESTIVERRPPYRSYIARTNAFFPGRPRDD